jgi:hypothetical protein
MKTSHSIYSKVLLQIKNAMDTCLVLAGLLQVIMRKIKTLSAPVYIVHQMLKSMEAVIVIFMSLTLGMRIKYLIAIFLKEGILNKYLIKLVEWMIPLNGMLVLPIVRVMNQ